MVPVLQGKAEDRSAQQEQVREGGAGEDMSLVLRMCYTCFQTQKKCVPDKYGMPICEKCLGKKKV